MKDILLRVKKKEGVSMHLVKEQSLKVNGKMTIKLKVSFHYLMEIFLKVSFKITFVIKAFIITKMEMFIKVSGKMILSKVQVNLLYPLVNNMKDSLIKVPSMDLESIGGLQMIYTKAILIEIKEKV